MSQIILVSLFNFLLLMKTALQHQSKVFCIRRCYTTSVNVHASLSFSLKQLLVRLLPPLSLVLGDY